MVLRNDLQPQWWFPQVCGAKHSGRQTVIVPIQRWMQSQWWCELHWKTPARNSEAIFQIYKRKIDHECISKPGWSKYYL